MWICIVYNITFFFELYIMKVKLSLNNKKSSKKNGEMWASMIVWKNCHKGILNYIGGKQVW